MGPTRTLAVVVLALACATGCSPAETSADARPPLTATADPGDGSSPGSEPGGDDRGTLTVEYDDAGHAMDLYLPAASAAPAPVALLVHGVAAESSPKDFDGLRTWGRRLSRAGFVVAVPNYEAVVGGSAAGVAQLSAALAHVRSLAPELGADPSAVVTIGFSAGGADWVAATFARANRPVRAAVGYYATIEPIGTGERRGPSLAAELRTRDLPVLLAYGAEDTAPGVADSLRAFRRSTRGDGALATVLVHPKAGHAFDVFERDAATRRIIDRTVRFLRAAVR